MAPGFGEIFYFFYALHGEIFACYKITFTSIKRKSYYWKKSCYSHKNCFFFLFFSNQFDFNNDNIIFKRKINFYMFIF